MFSSPLDGLSNGKLDVLRSVPGHCGQLARFCASKHSRQMQVAVCRLPAGPRPGTSLLPSPIPGACWGVLEDSWLERAKSTLGAVAAVLATVFTAPHCSGMLLGVLDFTRIDKAWIFFG